ncbi:rhomboid family intramembrane serine protease [Tropicibacter oceani]|uniref:Rhomboid family intramembrane serine protease n=1 Tax=Tropicibacter oceani TaxID=3058420 RepID=A0ABY8QL49_9RHOB|nr:rhomboid family intramembrane serine protease [Tropicibacter oceani]WGW05366.1 rhomboid family intramembrane serine protease [Tropicibacter oceani]
MSNPHNESPVNPLPPVVVALSLVLIGIELAFGMGARGLIGGPAAVGWRAEYVQKFAFSDRVFEWMRDTGEWPLEQLLRFASYPFLHWSFTQALFAAVILLAMGKIVAEVMGSVRMLILFFASSIGGALAYALILNDPTPLVGAFPGDYGLIGGFTYLLWVRLGRVGANQTRAFSLIGVLMALQLVFGLLFGGSNLWLPDIAGFATGFALSIVLVPGGFSRLLARMRRD